MILKIDNPYSFYLKTFCKLSFDSVSALVARTITPDIFLNDDSPLIVTVRGPSKSAKSRIADIIIYSLCDGFNALEIPTLNRMHLEKFPAQASTSPCFKEATIQGKKSLILFSSNTSFSDWAVPRETYFKNYAQTGFYKTDLKLIFLSLSPFCEIQSPDILIDIDRGRQRSDWERVWHIQFLSKRMRIETTEDAANKIATQVKHRKLSSTNFL
jgi:hypothetical protein